MTVQRLVKANLFFSLCVLVLANLYTARAGIGREPVFF